MMPTVAAGPTRYVRAVEELLLRWFAEHGRDLPRRKTRDPYAILVSEVMAQQYRIEIVDLPVMQGFSGYFGLSRLFAPRARSSQIGRSWTSLFARPFA